MTGSNQRAVLAFAFARILAAWVVAALGIAGLAPAAAAADDARTALVVGNGAYSYGPLANAVNDATDMAAALEAAGFHVILRTDADLRTMDEAIEEFERALAERGGVGMFYYSGHGVQVGDDNFILPIGDEIANDRDVKYGAVNLSWIVDGMSAIGNPLNIVVLDACRNNPLPSAGRSASRGLARVAGSGQMFIAFSTSPGSVAADGVGRNSPFTGSLVRAIGMPGLQLEDVFKETAKGVHQATDGDQVPWVSSSFFGKFAFTPGGAQAPALTPEPAVLPGTLAPPPALRESDLPGLYRASGSNPNGTTYTGMAAVSRSADDPGALNVRWWIGKQVFSGFGRPEGRWLTLTYSETAKAIYTRNRDGTLDGTWADGSGSERLERFAKAGKYDGSWLTGRYRAEGRNPNGGTYSGTARIAEVGDGRFTMEWQVGSTSYRGFGKFDGGIFTVDWGQTQPVIYVIGEDGVLTGLWSGGRGEEMLRPVH